MNPINNQPSPSLLKKLFYPIVTLIFIIIVVTVFIIVSRFLSKQLNQPFTANQDGFKESSSGINNEDVKVVEDRLSNNGTSEQTPTTSDTTQSQTPENTATETTTQTNPDQTTKPETTGTQTTENTSTTTPKAREDKTLLNISILNSTKTNGLAGNLKKTLEQNGYKNITAGNTETLNDHTVIKIGSSTKSQYETTLKELLTILQAQYPNTAIEEDNQLPTGTDTQIIIGSK